MEAITANIKAPNFLVVGTQKGGTTSLHEILNRHPEIFLPGQKELHFFDKDEAFEKGIDWYLREYFAEVKNEIAVGEITPNYMFIEEVPERIYNTLGGDMKFIFIFRDPAERAFSHYQMCIRRKTENLPFAEAIKLNVERIHSGDAQLGYKHYIDRGFYDEQLERYLRYFPKENMLFLLFEEDLIKNRKEAFDLIYEFLGVSRANISLNVKSLAAGTSKVGVVDKAINTDHPLNKLAKALVPNKNLRTNIKYHLNKINRKKQVDSSDLQKIRPELIDRVFKEHIIHLQELIDRDLSEWLE